MKRFIVPAIIILVAVLAAGGFFIWTKRQKPESTTTTALPTPTPTPQDLETWDDPAGFSFKYPKGIVIDKHDEDTQNYAHLEMTNTNYPGKIIVWAKDTTAASLDTWMKSTKMLKNAAAMDTTLGGLAGKKFVIKDPASMLITGTITDQIVFTVEAEPKDGEYWRVAYDTIVGSFAFTDNTATGEAGGDEIVADEEEVVE